MYKKKSKTGRVAALLFAFAIAFGSFPVGNVFASEENADYLPEMVKNGFLEMGEPIFDDAREEFFSDLVEADAEMDLETIILDNSNKLHQPQEYPATQEYLESAPQQQDAFYDANPITYSGPFEVGDTRPFRARIAGGSTFTFATVEATLVAAGEHSNIWAVNDDSWHDAKHDIHNANCKLPELNAELANELATNIDGIYERMTDPSTGFAAHAHTLINFGLNNSLTTGDLGDDGKVNYLFYDIEGDGGNPSDFYDFGFFDIEDSFTVSGSGNQLDMLHLDFGALQGYKTINGSAEEKLDFYGTVAHEFQHLLFNMYFGVYVPAGREREFIWINESLAELAATFYVQPGAEIVYYDFFCYASGNNYGGGDFVNFSGSLKNYGMGNLLSMSLYKKTRGSYPHDLYAYFQNIYPKEADFLANQAKFTGKTMDVIWGDAFKGATNIGTGGADSFAEVYNLFMEQFLADGGVIHGNSDIQTVKLQSGTNPVNNLWAIRQVADVTNGRVYYAGSSGSYHDASKYTTQRISNLPSTINLSGTRDMLYKLPGHKTNVPILRITVPGDNSGVRYYVAVPNDKVFNNNGTYTSGVTGADVYPLVKGTESRINTGGQPAYLFVVTLYQNANKTITYSWEQAEEDDFVGTVTLTPSAPKAGETITADVSASDSGSYTYKWTSDGKIVGNGTSSYTSGTEDIGKVVSVSVTSSSKIGNALKAQTAPVAKKPNTVTPTAPVLSAKSSTTVTLNTVAGYEYSNGGLLWQDRPMFTYLLPDKQYIFYQRVKATETMAASVGSAGLTVRTDLGGLPVLTGTPTITINPATGALTAGTTGLSGAGAFSYSWSGTGVPASATDAMLAQTAYSLGNEVTLTVTRAGSSGSVSAKTTVYRTSVNAVGTTGTDNVSIASPYGEVGDRVNIAYVLGSAGTLSNSLTYTGGSVAQVTSAGSGNSTYIVAAADATNAVNGVITITATFTHSNLPVLTGTPTITINPATGALTAGTTGLSGAGAFSYSWSGTGVPAGAANATLVQTAYSLGSEVTLTVTHAGSSGSASTKITVYRTAVNAVGATGADSVSIASPYCKVGDQVNIAYVLGSAGTLSNSLTCSGGSVAQVTSAGSGNSTYIVVAADATNAINGVITITATFTHSNLPTLTGTPTITINPATGALAAGTTGLSGGSGTFNYSWSGTGVPAGVNGATLVQGSYSLGNEVTLTVTRAGSSGSVSAKITVYRTSVNVVGATGADSVSIASPYGKVGDQVNIAYVLGGMGTLSNSLTYSGGSVAAVTSAGSGNSTYIVAAADATNAINGVITITATFTHSNLPVLTGTPTITINPATGELTAGTTGLSGSSGTFNYSWSGTGVTAGVTGATLALTNYSLGEEVTLTVTHAGSSGSVNAKTTVYRMAVNPVGAAGSDSVSIASPYGKVGDQVNIAYVLGNAGSLSNSLTYSSGSVAAVTSAGSGNSTYTVAAANATNGIITITATFAHTNLPQTGTPIDQAPLFITDPGLLTYGDAGFTFVTTDGSGSGAVTFSVPANNGVLNVAPNGAATIVGAGKVTVKATKAADSNYNEAVASSEIAVFPAKVDMAVIRGITAPVRGAAPVTAATETAQYTGTVSWSPAVSGVFAASTVYTAEITLTAKANYTFMGMSANFFTVTGAAVTNAADSGVVTVVFPATGVASGGGGFGGGGGGGGTVVNQAITATTTTAITTEPALTAELSSEPTPTTNIVVESTSDFPFTDVQKDAWYYNNVVYVYTHGLFAGTSATTFSPNISMTRGMLVTVLYRLAGEPAMSEVGAFSDIDSGAYYAKAVMWAKSNDIVSGVGNNLFDPNTPIARQDLTVILLRYADKIGLELPQTRPYVVFLDYTDNADYAKEAVAALYSSDIINGKPGNLFDPEGTATRAEVAAMLHRFIEVT